MDSASSAPPKAAPDYVGAGFKAVFQSGSKSPPPLSGTPTPAPTPPPAAEGPAGTPEPAAPEVTTVISPTASTPKKTKIGGKSLVLVGFLILLLGGLVVGFDRIRSFISNAEGSCLPENLAEANLTESAIEIVFQTGKACQMEVAYGISRDALLLQVPEAMASLNHRLRLTPLLASTTYYYQVVSEGKKLGTVRSFLTKAAAVTPTLPPEPTAIPVVETTPATASGTTPTYTLDDFKTQFGSDNPAFDIDKNGIVNMADWLAYQKQ